MNLKTFFFLLFPILLEIIECKESSSSPSPIGYNVIMKREVTIELIHKFVTEIKKRSSSKDFPNFHVIVDKVLTNMKMIKIIEPSEEAFDFITKHKFVKEFYETKGGKEL